MSTDTFAGFSARRATSNTRAALQTWETPPKLFAKLHGEFRFTLDVCALPDTAKCARYFTPQTDGLAQSWAGETCWMNPPYTARQITAWMEKARHESAEHGATVVALVPAHTGAKWWHAHVLVPGVEIRCLRGRITFLQHGKPADYGAPFPCVVVIYRPGAHTAPPQWRFF